MSSPKPQIVIFRGIRIEITATWPRLDTRGMAKEEGLLPLLPPADPEVHDRPTPAPFPAVKLVQFEEQYRRAALQPPPPQIPREESAVRPAPLETIIDAEWEDEPPTTIKKGDKDPIK